MNAFALAIGGFVGTILRYELGGIIPVQLGVFPQGILIINLAGCLFLGWFFTASQAIPAIPPGWRLGIGTGMTGAFTTFSTFSVQSVQLVQEGHSLTAVLYAGISLAGGLALVAAGIWLAKLHTKEASA